MVRTVQQRTARKARIAMQPQMPRPPGPSGKAEAPPAGAIDHIYVTLASESERAAIEQELDAIAGKFGLRRMAPAVAESGTAQIDYALGRRRTHSVHLLVAPRRSRAARSSAESSGARLAIIIDDLGYDRAAADGVLALPWPLTVAVLPNLPHSWQAAEEAQRRGLEVLLHLPMQSENGAAPPESVELRAGMPAQEAQEILARMLESVPYVAGVNNHQGSLATQDEKLMAAVMATLRERELFFIDSRTTAASVAYAAAQRAGVPAAYRSVFLDDEPDRDSILRQLRRAERQAREQGWAIAIGHPHPVTLAVLRANLPQLEARGFRFVFASELVH